MESKARPSAPDSVRDLIETFSANIADYKKPGFKEAQLRSQFLDGLLAGLGWDIGNKAGYAEQYKEVIVEDSLEDEGKKKAPDYCFRVGKERKFFVEAKKPSVDIGRDKAAAYQLRRYAWSAKLPLSIVSDFEELSVYDTRVKPAQGDNVATARVKTFHYTELVARWHELYDVFSKEAVLKGSFDRYSVIKGHRGTVEVDDDFLSTLEGWRLDLANAVHRHNKSLSIGDISYVTQATLDRILFLRICEDKGIETFGTLKAAGAKKGAYAALLELFRNAQQRYNSGLFHLFSENKSDPNVDRVSAGITLSDPVLSRIVDGLYHPNPYEFSVISPEILGSVYERFLGSELQVAGRSIVAELKPEQKKADGVYYTPAPVARYMVETALRDQFNVNSQERPRLRTLDMACGSGSFLIHAYDELLRLYSEWHVKRGTKAGPSLMRVPTPGGGSELRLSLAERRRILRDHIFGVDIDPQAVEVTKLSLFLKLIEDAAVLPTQLELAPFQSRVLPDLSANIKCGNSIVGHDVGRFAELSSEDLSEHRPLDWDDDADFGPILAEGGFDLVVGNPPYSYRKSTVEVFKSYYTARYSSTQGNYDIYKMFLERSTELVRSGGSICQIVNSSFLIQPQFVKMREILLDRLALQEIDVLGPNVFKGVTIDTAIIRGRRRGRGVKIGKIKVKEPVDPSLVASSKAWEISQSRLARNDGLVIDWRLNDARAAIVDRIFSSHTPLQAGYDLSVGINTGSMKSDLVGPKKASAKHHQCVPGTGISRYGAVEPKGYILYDPKVIKAAGARGRSLPPERFFSADKILVVRTRNTSLKRRLISTLDLESKYHLNRLTSIIAKDGSDLRTLLAVLNSSMVNYIFLTRYFNYEIKPVFLRDIPIPTWHDATLSKSVDNRLALTTALQAAGTPARRSLLSTEIKILEQKIDDRVFQLYGLTADESKMIQAHIAELPGSL